MHLEVDAAVTLKDLEETLITPSIVPRIDTKPVILTVLNAPADYLDSVTSEVRAGLVRVNTRLVGQEVFVDRECSGDGTICKNFGLDAVRIGIYIVARSTKVLVVSVSAS